MKEKLSIIFSLIFVAFFVAYWGFSQGTNNNSSSFGDTQTKDGNQYSNKNKTNSVKISSSTAEKEIVVYIKGAVKNPGEYHVPYGSKVQDLIVVAGGCLDNADTSTLALNKILRQNQTIKVPFNSSSDSNQSLTVNVNIASLEELNSLPGIGKVIAERIIDERNRAKFKDIEDFKQRLNLSSAKIDRLKGLITF
ncbi:Soluble ligand binding domain protein [Thermodesulfobium narugense DSM 14796]|uniref:Soluble ligand binding domain protein n=1 Tax=Thermodesulfobium narugense DSM 14796 TaxID=747365 RepID=M1E7K5_9BACT|nr:ComEA family DNA-binding protein [Thermodesulfobium narugense]AEE14510.1 Soluble ligand binding domain protein [Thermodesulfobium narugense DSM 14796]